MSTRTGTLAALSEAGTRDSEMLSILTTATAASPGSRLVSAMPRSSNPSAVASDTVPSAPPATTWPGCRLACPMKPATKGSAGVS